MSLGDVYDFKQSCLFVVLVFEELLVKFFMRNANVLIGFDEHFLGLAEDALRFQQKHCDN